MRALAFGTFDIFHPGHEFYLKEAKKLADELYVVVAKDSTVRSVKGRKPVNEENSRLAVIQKLPFVDKAMLGSQNDKYAVLDVVKPDVIVLGYDQDSFTAGLEEELRKRRLNPQIVRAESYMPEKWKSSKLIKNINNIE